jgi:DNA-binding transcriptional MerR regulator
VSSRTYLSIGDVLTLLREEFPDVTISKIRFLESQGLVNPERSPSGYRKFFDHDVERLRWVLRQQREHFLPLKVIRDRLADGELDDPSALEETVNGNTSVPSLSTVGPTADRQTAADDEAMKRIIADASRRAARVPDASTETRAVHALAGTNAQGAPLLADGAGVDAARSGSAPHAMVAAGAAVLRDDAQPSTAPSLASASSTGGASSRASATGEPPPASTSARAADVGSSAPRSVASEATTPPTATSAASSPAASTPTPAATSSPKSPPPAPSSAPGNPGIPEGTAGSPSKTVVTGVSMTGAEVCAASGLAPEELSDLENYGLVESLSVAGIPTYDEEALAIANLAAAFRVFGIEARHLRQYRIAVDREIGLIEQVVIPLLRQRNPEARQRALDGAEQMAALGESMRAALLRVSVRHHLRG